MKHYHIVYAKNRIVSCSETKEKNGGDEPYYEHNRGQLSFAIVKADNESQARSIAKYLAIELNQKFRQHDPA
ncbi:MAG: hypothetical protein K0R82_2570 [Flavipsychrobacter sp.]|jgi:hypothetical protein|nr:hypothetical protein [Flavipsychrobacter sp.]